MEASVVSVLVAGFLLGLKHALDPDHVVAVSTIISRRGSLLAGALIGAWWGAGHTSALLVVGIIVLLFNAAVPETVALSFEFAVGIMLVILGLWTVVRHAQRKVHVHPHSHDDEPVHVHFHSHQFGADHDHAHDVDPVRMPFLVGIVHGLAGSGALLVLHLAAVDSPVVGLVYIVVFGVGSIVGMWAIGLALGLPWVFSLRYPALNRAIGMAAGAASTTVGGWLLWEVGFAGGLLNRLL